MGLQQRPEREHHNGHQAAPEQKQVLSLKVLNHQCQKNDRGDDFDDREYTTSEKPWVLACEADLLEHRGSIIQNGSLTSADSKNHYPTSPEQAEEILTLKQLFHAAPRRCLDLFLNLDLDLGHLNFHFFIR